MGLTPGIANLRLALGLGVVGVVIFGMTLPITRLAVLELDPLFVTLGRASIAALMAIALLAVARAVPPPRDTWPWLLVFGLCVTIGYRLSMGGIAKVGQVQLVQPFVTLAASALLLGEHIGWLEIGFSVLVVGLVGLGSRMRVTRQN